VRATTRASAGTDVEQESVAAAQTGATPVQRQLLGLQRTAGNGAVARHLQRLLADPEAEAATEEQAAGNLEQAKKLFKKGAAFYERGDYAHAHDYFTRANELAPRSALIFSRAQALRKLGGRRDEAISLYEEYLNTEEPTRKKDAEAALAELRGPAPTGNEEIDLPEAKKLFTKGAAAYEQGRYGQAYDLFTAASELAPRSALTFSRAQALRKLGGRREEAISLYEEYLNTEEPTRKKDAEAALAELRGPAATGDEAIDLPEARKLFQKGAAAYEKRRYGQAYDYFTMAHALTPRSALVFSRAQALRKLGGRRDETVALYEEYLDTEEPTRKKDAEQALAELKQSGAAP
jgi:tetratricopeptide (TPR) repeat protein